MTTVHSLQAANRYWDGGAVDIPAVGNTASAGGAGTWNTTLLNWDAGASPHVAWNNAANDTAIFAGTGAAVNVAVPITVGGVTLSSAGYVFSGSTVEIAAGGIFTGPANGNHNFAGFALAPGNTTYRFQSSSTSTGNLANNVIFTMPTVLTGAGNSVVISGTQPVYLTGGNSYGGGTTINAGSALGFTTANISGLAAGSVTVGASSLIMRTGGNLNQTFLNLVAPTSTAFTVVANNAGCANNLDFTNYPNASLSFWDNVGTQIFTLTGTITPAASTYRFGTPKSGNNINLTLANALTGSRSVVVNGGNLRLAASMDFTGTVTINAGTFTIGSPVVAFPTAGNGQIGGGNYAANILNNGTVAHTSALDQTLSGVISGTGGVTKSFTTSTGANAGTWGTTSTLTLSGANTYTGVTSALAGILSFNSIGDVGGGASALGAPVTIAGGTIAMGTTTTGGTLLYTGSGHTSNRVVNLAGTTGGAIINASGSGPLVLTSNLTATGAGIKSLTLSGTSTADNTLGGIVVNNSATNTTALVKSGTGTWVLSGANTYTGGTTVGGGVLKLEYGVADSGKLIDTGVLTLAGGTLELSGGTHLEAVGSTTLGAGTVSYVTRSSGSAKLALKTITPAASASVDFGADGIATTDNTNTNGILGTWATVGGNNWAANLTGLPDGDIVAYSGYTDIDARGSTITDALASNVRIVADGAGGSITLGSTTTTINTLLQGNPTIDATLATAGKTLATSAIWISAGKAALTVGAAANDGILSSSTVAGNLALINDNPAKNLTVNAVVADNGGASTLSTSGPGTVILNGTNTHSGGTTLGGGTLVLGSGAALGSGFFTIAAGALASTGSVVIPNDIDANGDFSFTGTGTLSSTGIMLLNANRIITNNNTTGTTSLFDISGSGRNLTISGDGNTSVTGVIGTGTGGLTKSGGGTLTLTSDSSYTGATNILGGTLQIGNGGNTGSIAGASIVTNDASLVFNLNDDPVAEHFVSNTIRGTGTLTKQSNGRLVLTGNSTFTGATTISGGILQIGNGTTGSISSTTSLTNNAGLVYNRSNALTVGHPINGSGTLTQIGSGTLTLTGINTYTGDTSLDAGILSAGATENLGDPSSDLVFNGGALQITGTTLTNFSGIGHTVVFNPDQTVGLDINNALNTFTVDQVLNQGLGGFTKLGAGTAILNQANTYTGDTVVTTGALLVNSPGSLAAGSLVFVDGGTLGGNGTVGGTVTVAAPANLAPGASAGTLAIGGTLDIDLQAAGTGKLVFELDALAGTNDKITVGGTLEIGTDVLGFNNFTFTNLGGLEVGTYKLITSAGIVGTLDPANLSGSLGAFNGALQVTGNDLELVVTPAPPFEIWIAGFSVGALTGLNDDPDADGVPNFLEFALNSSPASGGSRGKTYVKLATVGGTPGVLTYTIAARSGATFAAAANNQQAVVGADSLTYTVEAANDLADWGTPLVSEVTGADATAIQASLPLPDSGWTYFTFRTDDDSTSDSRDFIRAKVTSP